LRNNDINGAVPPMDNNDKPIEPEFEVDSGSEFLFRDDQPGLLVDAVTPGGEDALPPGRTPDGEFTVKARSQFSQVIRRFRQHKLAMISLVVLLLVILAAFVFGPLWKYGPTEAGNDFSQPPSGNHPFGTDNQGYDTLAQVLAATRLSLKIAFSVAIAATVIGSIYGAVAGFYRGLSDTLMMRFVDLVLTIPALAIGALLGKKYGSTSWVLLAAVLSALLWTGVSRVVRGQALSLREKEYIEAARALGASDTRIIFRHILPNVAGPIIVLFTLLVAGAILAESALSFLGFGVQFPDVSLGLLVSDGETAAVGGRGWLFYFPGLFIILIALTVNFIGDGLRDALDPTQTKVRA
jgi:ABC-type dipeptide/oligopeptide/nickel transport system permease subunit